MNHNKLDGFSMDLESDNKQKLQAVFPECFAEGKLDIDKLLSLCGEYIDEDFEKYKFEWKGKANCLKVAQKRSRGTLRPKQAESVNFDTTENLYIEGDNLEVLKLLQTAYYRKVKMIYIDPPYNTGHDFVYEDDFKDSLAKYKEVTSQATKSNPESMGRFHTNWLNMMYPRLRLAANLLSDDGVIFISIDDNEVFNLKKICDEVFGEENFVFCFSRVTKKAGKSTESIAKNNDFFLMYTKSMKMNYNLQEHTDDGFKYKDEYFEERGHYKLNQTLDYDSLQYSSSLDYPIEVEEQIIYAGGSYEKYLERKKGNYARADWAWRWSKDLFDFGYEQGFIVVKKYETYSRIYTKTYEKAKIEKENGKFVINTIDRTKALSSLEFIENMYSNDNAKKNLLSLFETSVFDYSKPISFIKFLTKFITNENDTIFDFFSGSATTAHAVMQLNAEDGGNRKFICVQLPELTDEKSEAYKNGYHNICEIGKERIRRAGKKILEETPQATLEERETPLDVGFKVLSLDTSNLQEWDSTPVSLDELSLLKERFSSMLDGIKDDRSDMDVVYEVMIKTGVTLDVPVTHMEVNGKLVYVVGDLLLMICLAENLTLEDVQEMIEYPMGNFVVAEACFGNDDSLMSNLYYIFKNKEVQYHLI